MIRSHVAALTSILLAAPASAQVWTVDPEASALNFFSLKNDEIAEQHAFTGLSGSVAADGTARIEISLASVASGIDIRDQRMRDMLFQVADWPLAEVSAQVDPAAFEALAPGQGALAEVTLTVETYGETAEYPASLAVTRLAQDRVAISTVSPILVSAGDFGYGDGVDSLREVAGLDAISPDVPVVFLLVLER